MDAEKPNMIAFPFWIGQINNIRFGYNECGCLVTYCDGKYCPQLIPTVIALGINPYARATKSLSEDAAVLG